MIREEPAALTEKEEKRISESDSGQPHMTVEIENDCPEEEEDESWIQDQEEDERFPSFFSWLGTVLLMILPAVNLIVLFEWASGNTSYSIRVNFAKAMIPAILAVYAVLAIGILFL